jgi:hypothetical protein
MVLWYARENYTFHGEINPSPAQKNLVASNKQHEYCILQLNKMSSSPNAAFPDGALACFN